MKTYNSRRGPKVWLVYFLTVKKKSVSTLSPFEGRWAGLLGGGAQIILQCRIFKAFLPSFYSCLYEDSCHLGHMNVKAVLVNNENRIPSKLLPIHFSEQFL